MSIASPKNAVFDALRLLIPVSSPYGQDRSYSIMKMNLIGITKNCIPGNNTNLLLT